MTRNPHPGARGFIPNRWGMNTGPSSTDDNEPLQGSARRIFCLTFLLTLPPHLLAGKIRLFLFFKFWPKNPQTRCYFNPCYTGLFTPQIGGSNRGFLKVSKIHGRQLLSGWWNQIFIIFCKFWLLPGEIIQFDLRIFFKPPTRINYQARLL